MSKVSYQCLSDSGSHVVRRDLDSEAWDRFIRNLSRYPKRKITRAERDYWTMLTWLVGFPAKGKLKRLTIIHGKKKITLRGATCTKILHSLCASMGNCPDRKSLNRSIGERGEGRIMRL